MPLPGSAGLKLYQVTDALLRSCPYKWRRLTIALDEGSDGKAAFYALTSPKYRLNMECHFDMNHGLWNNMKQAIRDCGMWPTLIMAMISWNSIHGPYDQDMFYKTFCDAHKEYFKTSMGPSDPAFQAQLPRLLHDSGEPELMASPGTAEMMCLTPLQRVCLSTKSLCAPLAMCAARPVFGQGAQRPGKRGS